MDMSQQIPEDSEGQGSLACCSPWGHKELDVTEQLNNKKKVENMGKEFWNQTSEGFCNTMTYKRYADKSYFRILYSSLWTVIEK